MGDNIINYFVTESHKIKKFCGLSGSMKKNTIEYAMNFKSDFIGFRGALCSPNSRDNIESIQCQNIIKKIKDINQKMYQEAV